MNAVVGEALYGDQATLYTCLCLQTRGSSGPPRGGVSIPFLSEGSGLLYRGSGTPWGVRDSAVVRTSTGGPEPPAVRAERLLLPEHVVLPDLSQPGDGSGTVIG